MIRIFFTAILIFSFAAGISAQSKQKKTTLEILEKSLSAEFEKIFFSPEADRTKKFIFQISVSDDTTYPGEEKYKEFITGIIKKTASKIGLDFSITKSTNTFNSDSSYNKISVAINKIETKYPGFVKNKFLGEKTILRNIKADLDINIYLAGDLKPNHENIHIDRTDEISYDDIQQYESEDYGFTKAEPPQVSTVETLIFPVAIIFISAAATILFFTIRTK